VVWYLQLAHGYRRQSRTATSTETRMVIGRKPDPDYSNFEDPLYFRDLSPADHPAVIVFMYIWLVVLPRMPSDRPPSGSGQRPSLRGVGWRPA
jgi:hypothetical protein